jgi:SAM-dependent methyltransferase
VETKTLDPVWEQRYHAGHVERYPWDIVVTFVFRNAPRDRPRKDVRILEVGCGTGSNLWFAAREGFAVAGIDGSASAIAVAKARFAEEGLAGELVVGDFTEPLPFASGQFDLAFDRGAIVCVGYSAAQRTIAEVHRVLAPGGKFLFNPYSKAHTSYQHAVPRQDGLFDNVSAGTLTGVGQLCFYDEAMVRGLLTSGWFIESLIHTEHRDLAAANPNIHAEWRVIARKTDIA